jgi:hypothetical protein
MTAVVGRLTTLTKIGTSLLLPNLALVLAGATFSAWGPGARYLYYEKKHGMVWFKWKEEEGAGGGARTRPPPRRPSTANRHACRPSQARRLVKSCRYFLRRSGKTRGRRNKKSKWAGTYLPAGRSMFNVPAAQSVLLLPHTMVRRPKTPASRSKASSPPLTLPGTIHFFFLCPSSSLSTPSILRSPERQRQDSGVYTSQPTLACSSNTLFLRSRPFFLQPNISFFYRLPPPSSSDVTFSSFSILTTWHLASTLRTRPSVFFWPLEFSFSSFLFSRQGNASAPSQSYYYRPKAVPTTIDLQQLHTHNLVSFRSSVFSQHFCSWSRITCFARRISSTACLDAPNYRHYRDLPIFLMPA